MDNTVRIALANVPFPATPDDSVRIAENAIADAATQGAAIVCFPECFVPGYRAPHTHVPPPDQIFLDRAWTTIADAARRANIGVILGTERVTAPGVLISALVLNRDGTTAGFQDKVQLDPSEDNLYAPAATPDRRVFQCGPLTFGIAICHEGWRYPETVRAAARQGAHVVFHPHYHWAGAGSHRATAFADPANTFHEKAVLCRAAENTCYFASVNYASDGSPTTSAIANPDGTLLGYQPYGKEGVFVADVDLGAATRVLAMRYRDRDNGGC